MGTFLSGGETQPFVAGPRHPKSTEREIDRWFESFRLSTVGDEQTETYPLGTCQRLTLPPHGAVAQTEGC